MSKRAAIYARVSTDIQRDNFSIPSQVAECVRLAKKRGYTIVADQYVNPENGYDTPAGKDAIPAFVDDYSSRELSRPGLDAALLYLEKVGYDVLIVLALDRLARDPYIRQTLEREFTTRGAKVEYVQGSYEETPEGEVRGAHRERLLEMGKWLKVYGETIYGTRKSFMKPAQWGVAVEKGNKVFLHILAPEKTGGKIQLKNLPFTVKKAQMFDSGEKVRFSPAASGGVILEPEKLIQDAVDQVLVLTVKRIGG